MKKSIIGVLLLFSLCGNAQSADSIAIRQTMLDYVEGYFNADWQRVSKAVHPELVKRIMVTDSSGQTAVNNQGASMLILGAKRNKKPDTSVPFKAEVYIYDIFKNTAVAKIETNKFQFIDYAQLVKIGGEWKILNVLWALK